jgi:hypothetical protein
MQNILLSAYLHLVDTGRDEGMTEGAGTQWKVYAPYAGPYTYEPGLPHA